jgi:MoxR-like ATPase
MTTTEQTRAGTSISPLTALHMIEGELQHLFLEREEVIRAALVALVSSSHMVLLGAPGSAKSELITSVASRFGLSTFTWLMTRFTTPDEVFGPVSLDGMKLGSYERVTTHKAPEAQVIFLDEVFKSSSAIMNCFLTMQQERVFDNGISRKPVPLVSFFGASNELPQGEDTAAAWDRYLLRLEVDYLADGNFEKLLLAKATTGTPLPPTTMTQAHLFALQQQAQAITIPNSIVSSLVTLRRELKEEKGIIASDRRWVQCLNLVKGHALIEGHSGVEEDDLAILTYALWSLPEHRQEIAKKINKLANPFNAKAAELKDEATKIWNKAKEDLRPLEGRNDEQSSMSQARITVEAVKKINKIIKDLEITRDQAQEQGRDTKRVLRALDNVQVIRKQALEASGL